MRHPAFHLTDLAGPAATIDDFAINGGGRAGDDVVETTYPDSLTVSGGKGTDTLIVHWGADANNVTVDLSADARTGGYDGVITDGEDSATIQFKSFERFDITTGAGADALYGGDGDDNLNGGAGADLMSGGLGNDTYHIDNAQDVIIESADGGIDTVVSTQSYTLKTDFENLTFEGPGRHIGVGNTVDNVLTASDAGERHGRGRHPDRRRRRGHPGGRRRRRQHGRRGWQRHLLH
jgi:Ca2+-binding RTX toxin-like protein